VKRYVMINYNTYFRLWEKMLSFINIFLTSVFKSKNSSKHYSFTKSSVMEWTPKIRGNSSTNVVNTGRVSPLWETRQKVYI